MGMTIEIDEQMIEREVERQIAARLKQIDVNKMVEREIRDKVSEIVTDDYIKKCAYAISDKNFDKEYLMNKAVDLAVEDVTSRIKQVLSNTQWQKMGMTVDDYEIEIELTLNAAFKELSQEELEELKERITLMPVFYKLCEKESEG